MRNIDPAISSELAREAFQYFFLLELQLSATYRFNDIDIPIYHSGELFAPRSFSFDQLRGSANLSVESLDLEIDDTDQVISALLLGEDVRNRTAVLHCGVMGEETEFVSSATSALVGTRIIETDGDAGFYLPHEIDLSASLNALFGIQDSDGNRDVGFLKVIGAEKAANFLPASSGALGAVVDSGEALGSELISAWTPLAGVPSLAYETLTVNANGHDLTAVVNSADSGYARTNAIAGITSGWSVKVVTNLTLNSGTAPNLWTIASDGSVLRNLGVLPSGANTLYVTMQASEVGFAIYNNSTNVNCAILFSARRATSQSDFYGSFSFVVRAALPNWVSGSTIWFATKWVSSTGYAFGIAHNGAILMMMNGAPIEFSNPNLAAGSKHIITYSVSVGATTSVTIFIDGTLFETIGPFANLGPFDTTANLMLMGVLDIRYGGLIDVAILYNRALVQANVTALVAGLAAGLDVAAIAAGDQWGGSIRFDDNWAGATGSTPPTGWTSLGSGGGTDFAITNLSAVNGFDAATLVATAAAGGNYRLIRLTDIVPGVKHVTSFRYRYQQGTAAPGEFRFGEVTQRILFTNTGLTGNAVIVPDQESIPVDAWFDIVLYPGDVLQIDKVYIRNPGATLALLPSGIGDAGWEDASANDMDATYPAAGADVVRHHSIVSTPGGSTRNWLSKGGVDLADADGYTYGMMSKIHIQELMRGIIGGWDIYGDSKVKIGITNEMVLWNKRSLRPQSSSCPWTFKGTECAYAGPETWCDQSYGRCVFLENTVHFGGERFLPAIAEREIWWGRQRGA